jgi:epoxyqueuosine reductase QueG
VIVFFIPFKEELVKENKKGDRPCRNWGVAYVQTNELIGRVGQALEELLRRHGFKSGLTPATANFDEVKLMARWSHKHLGDLAGLGHLGTHRMLITPAGCTGRLGSLVTEAELEDSPVIETKEACLLKAGYKCGKCIGGCPVSALSEKDFDRQGCWKRLKENRRTLEGFFDLPESTHVCGKCAALMPCSFKNPVASKKS